MARSRGVQWLLVIIGYALLALGCGGSPDGSESLGQTSAAVVTSGGASVFVLGGLPATITSGVTGTFTVRAVDASGNTAPGYTGTVHLSANYPATTFSPNYTFTAADQGVHTFSYTPFEAGTQILYATDTASSSITGSATVVCIAAAAAQYEILSITPSSPSAGQQATFAVTAYDANWNVATTYSGSGVVTSSDSTAILPPNAVFSAGQAAAVPITFNKSGGQSYTITDSLNPSITATAWVTISAAPSATITAPASVSVGATGLAASVTTTSGATYAWTITNGTITSSTTTSAITFTAGTAGTLSLKCVVTKGASSATGTKNVTVVGLPVTPTITAASPVSTGKTGYTASVVANPGMTYAWTIAGGTITNTGGAAGVTASGVNKITYTAGAVGTITITCAEVNPALVKSAPATATVQSVGVPVAPVITAPTSVTTGDTGLVASVPLTAGMSYVWTITGGTITSTGGTSGVTGTTNNAITFTAGAAGTLKLTCAENNGVTTGTAAKASVTVLAAPTTPVITATSPVSTGATGLTATVVAHTGMHYLWTISGGTITSAGGTAGVTSGTTNKITYTAGAVGTIALTATELNAANAQSATASASVIVVVGAPVTPTITSASPVTTGVAGLTASVTARSGMTYVWTIAGGAITSAGGTSGVTNGTTNTLTFTAGAAGTITLTCAESNGAQTSAAATKSVTVDAAPATPVINVAAQVTSTTTGLTATVTANPGMTYAWTISGGTITSATAGVISGGVDTVTFTSGSPGTLTLGVTEKNGANATSAPGSATVTVIQSTTPPVTPTITAASPITSGLSGTAQVTARSGMTYTWTIAGGAITSAGGPAGVTSGTTNTIAYTAGAAGTLSLTCTESNGTTSSTPGTASVTVLAAPQTPTITTVSTANAAQAGITASVGTHAGMTYAWTISGGTITSSGGAAGVTSGSTNTITFTAGSSGTISLSCIEVNGAGATSGSGSASIAITGTGPTPTGHLYVVAHQDDDLLFQNPDIMRSIQSGHPTRVVFVTAAGSPDLASWQAREHGVYTPYLTMANVAFDPYADSITYYTCGPKTFNGFPVQMCTMNANPLVTVVFMRLGDGDLSSLWDTDGNAPFYVTPSATLKSADGVNTYSKTTLIATIAAIMRDFNPSRLGTMDSTFAYGDDHQDHVTSALLAIEAAHLYGVPMDHRIYRGYSMDGAPDYYTVPGAEAVNLSPAEYAQKHAIMVAYGGDFPNGGTYDNWCHRRYVIERLAPTTATIGAIVEPGGKCLDSKNGATADGTALTLNACTGAAAQRWTITPDYQLVGPGGKCATIAASSAVQISTCAGTAAQKWTAFANGQIRGQNAKCLSNNEDGTILSDFCDADTSANLWQPDPDQRFTQQASPTFAWSSGTNFSDADVGANSSSYRSLRLLNVDADGWADACIRLSGGLFCGINNHSSLGAYTSFSSDFSDENSWLGDGYGSTVQLADVNGDGINDACGRSAAGIVCGLGNGSNFASATTWTAGFSDAAGFSGAAYYRSVHFGDVNGDGYADVCGRSAGGIVCALNTKSGAFAASTSWLSTDFTDALGWSADAYASTVQLADVDGDKRADVCGRGPSGLVCAMSDGASTFVNDHLWSFRTNFADSAGWSSAAGYYGSIHFGDVNGDGFADVCGRTTTGVVCSYSDGTGFESALAIQPNDYTDALGWKPDMYGTSIQIADINHDGHADVCGRSTTGLLCTSAP